MISYCDLRFKMMIKKNYAQKFYWLNMKKCVRVTISAHVWLVSKLYLLMLLAGDRWSVDFMPIIRYDWDNTVPRACRSKIWCYVMLDRVKEVQHFFWYRCSWKKSIKNCWCFLILTQATQGEYNNPEQEALVSNDLYSLSC